MIKRILCWLFGHHHDMTFPKDDLDWLFVCRRCGHTTTDIYEAEE